MRIRRRVSTVALVGALAFVTVSTPAPGSAQNAPAHYFGIGYVANAPDLLGGVSGYAVFPILGGLGLYVDAKFDLDSPSRDDTFISTLTDREVEEQVAGAEFIDDADSWQGFNFALVRPLSPSLMVYAGAGVATRTRYREYRDPEGEMGRLGFFIVEAPDDEWTSVNALAGGFLRLGRWLDFQFGLETRPRGFTVGGALRLPPR
jgi:hypothetical protein